MMRTIRLFILLFLGLGFCSSCSKDEEAEKIEYRDIFGEKDTSSGYAWPCGKFELTEIEKNGRNQSLGRYAGSRIVIQHNWLVKIAGPLDNGELDYNKFFVSEGKSVSANYPFSHLYILKAIGADQYVDSPYPPVSHLDILVRDISNPEDSMMTRFDKVD